MMIDDTLDASALRKRRRRLRTIGTLVLIPLLHRALEPLRRRSVALRPLSPPRGERVARSAG